MTSERPGWSDVVFIYRSIQYTIWYVLLLHNFAKKNLTCRHEIINVTIEQNATVEYHYKGNQSNRPEYNKLGHTL